MNHTQRARERRIAERERMEALRQRTSLKGAIIVPKPPKEEIQQLIQQANINADRIVNN